MSTSKNSRIETLDWLRGLMALSIMFYHLICWIFFPLDSTNPLGRLGVYGVSIFFILSGLSMAIVYNQYINTFRASINFYVRRVFRIWPLLWIICILAILPETIKTGYFSWKLLFLNLTTLFGFIKPTAYIATGAWSIGNEMVYYALTPIIFKLYNYRKWIGNMFLIFCICIGLFFAFNLLNPNINLSEQWALYVNPFNNLFLYVMGVAIYYNFKNLRFNPKLNNTLLITAITLFCLLPFDGNQISILTGMGRVIFVFLSFIIVLCFYKLEINLPIFFSNTLETLGIATYGIYLIHPIIYKYTSYILDNINLNYSFLLFGIVIITTIVSSIISYRFFELKLIKMGKKITSTSK